MLMKRLNWLITMSLVFAILLSFFTPLKTYAMAKERESKVNKKAVDIKDQTFYVSASLSKNFDSNNVPQDYGYLNNLNVSFNNDKVDIKIDRSEINKMFKEGDKNTYFLMDINFDVYDLPSGYVYLRQGEGDIYWAESCYQETVNKYGFFEGFGTSIEVFGGRVTEPINGSRYIIVNDPNLGCKSSYTSEDFDKSKIVFDWSSKFTFTIVEDAVRDFKNIEDFYLLEPSNENADSDGYKTIKNYHTYTVVEENGVFRYQWTMYNDLGEETYFDFDKEIILDDSEYKDQIASFFDDLDGKIKHMTFKHHGELGGKAEITVQVGDTFKTGDLTSLYYYDNDTNTMKKMDNNIKIDANGYATFEITHCSEYILVSNGIKLAENMIENSTTNIIEKKSNNSNDSNDMIIYGIIGVGILALATTGLIIYKKKKNK